MVAGQWFDPGAWNRLGPGGLVQTHAWLTQAASLRQRLRGAGLAGTPADPQLQPLATNGGFGGFGGSGGNMGWDQALQGTDVLLTFGGAGLAQAGTAGGQRRWTIWGQGDLQAFRGAPETVRGYEATSARDTWGSTPWPAGAGCSVWRWGAAPDAEPGRWERPRDA